MVVVSADSDDKDGGADVSDGVYVSDDVGVVYAGSYSDVTVYYTG